jgi:hypothetical protein
MEIPADILEREKRFWSASTAYYEQWLARDAIFIFPPPVGIIGRAQAIEGIAAGARWAGVDMTEVAARQLADAAFALTYKARASKEGRATVYCALIGSIYIFESDDWKLAFHQHTVG